MKNTFKYKTKFHYIFFFFALILFACEKEESPKNTEAELLKIQFSFGEAEINADTKTGIIKAPEGTDLSSMMASITVSEGATIYPPSDVALDFSEPITFTVTSEDGATKETYTITAYLPVAYLNIMDIDNWSIENPGYDVAGGATIDVYTAPDWDTEPELFMQLKSDENGDAVIHCDPSLYCFILASKGNKKNLKDNYVVLGRYETQESIDNGYFGGGTPPEVGDIRYSDINGDGIVNSDDQVDYQKISIEEGEIKNITIYLTE